MEEVVEDYPRTLAELESRFSSEQACREYLFRLRWPGGFRCSRCDDAKAWPLRSGLWQCARCRYQISVTAGTIFQDTRTPLTVWFRAMWWVTSQKNGVSALGLQRVLGLGSYQTAWAWLHKLRRAMVRPGRDRLSGKVEVDETYLGGLEEEMCIRDSCNPRGFRAYVRNDTFFRCIALTTKRRSDIVFAAVGMQGNPVAERWISSLGIRQNVRLLPILSRAEMGMLLRTSDVMVSPSEHDGTPNTLLESMAAGAFPIVGDIESLREWITEGVNGSLREPWDAEGFSEAILGAIANSPLRLSAALKNRQLIEERAEYGSSMERAERFYQRLICKSEMNSAPEF